MKNRMDTVALCASDEERCVGDRPEKQVRQTSSQCCPWDNWHPITDLDSYMADALATAR